MHEVVVGRRRVLEAPEPRNPAHPKQQHDASGHDCGDEAPLLERGLADLEEGPEEGDVEPDAQQHHEAQHHAPHPWAHLTALHTPLQFNDHCEPEEGGREDGRGAGVGD